MSTNTTSAPPKSSGDIINERFKALSALDQAMKMNELSTIHVKSVKVEQKTNKPKKQRDPDAPPKEQGEKVKQWYSDIEKIQEEFGIKKDEKGNPMYKMDKNGESKPVYIVSYKEAMKLASQRRNESGEAAPASKPKKARDADAPVSEAPKTASRTKTVPVAPTVTDDEDDDIEEPMPFIFKGEMLLKYSNGDTWVKNPDNTRGEWKGVYNPAKKRFDKTAPEDEPNY